MPDIRPLISDLWRRIVEALGGDDVYETPLVEKVVREVRSAFTTSPYLDHGRVFAPPVIEIEMRQEDVSALQDAIGTDDPTAYIRDKVNDAYHRDVVFPEDFQVLLLESDRSQPGRPRCTTKTPKLELAPYLASISDGLLAPRNRRRPLGPETEITRDWLSSIVPADMEISNKRHAVITIVSRGKVEIRPVPNRYTAVDGLQLAYPEVLRYRAGGYRLTFGGRQLLLYWVEDFPSRQGGGRV